MISDCPGPRTERALEGARDAFLQNVEERRLRLFRGCLQASVTSASPLAISFAQALGPSLDDVFQVMTPPAFWPQSTGSLALRPIRWEVPTSHVRRSGGDERMMWRVVRAGGYAMRVGGDGGWVGWRVSGDTVEVAGRLGAAALVTNRGTLRLWVPQSLPATLCAAMPGRPLTSIVQHPLLTDDGMAIVSVDDHSDGGHVLRVRAGKRQFSAPWPGLLAALLVAHAEPSVAALYRREA